MTKMALDYPTMQNRWAKLNKLSKEAGKRVSFIENFEKWNFKKVYLIVATYDYASFPDLG